MKVEEQKNKQISKIKNKKLKNIALEYQTAAENTGGGSISVALYTFFWKNVWKGDKF